MLKKHSKKVLAIILTLLMIFSMTACGEKKEDDKPEDTQQTASQTESTTKSQTSTTETQNSTEKPSSQKPEETKTTESKTSTTAKTTENKTSATTKPSSTKPQTTSKPQEEVKPQPKPARTFKSPFQFPSNNLLPPAYIYTQRAGDLKFTINGNNIFKNAQTTVSGTTPTSKGQPIIDLVQAIENNTTSYMLSDQMRENDVITIHNSQNDEMNMPNYVFRTDIRAFADISTNAKTISYKTLDYLEFTESSGPFTLDFHQIDFGYSIDPTKPVPFSKVKNIYIAGYTENPTDIKISLTESGFHIKSNEPIQFINTYCKYPDNAATDSYSTVTDEDVENETYTTFTEIFIDYKAKNDGTIYTEFDIRE